MIIAFDLDGTLCNIEHRLHHIQGEKKDWRAFFAACVDDVPIHDTIEVLLALNSQSHRIEIWSGRSDEVRSATEEWLREHVTFYDKVRMRREGDHRPDYQVKQEWLRAIPHNEWPKLAFDDRQQVVDMWRSNGVRCFQVAPGNF